MSLLAALVLAVASARVESVSLTTLDSRLAVRVLVSGTPGMVAVHREGDVARVSIMDADLGLRFAGGRRFSWTPSDGFDPALLAATPAKLDRLEIAAGASEVSVLLHVPPEVSVDVRPRPARTAAGVSHGLRPGGAGAGRTSSAGAGSPRHRRRPCWRRHPRRAGSFRAGPGGASARDRPGHLVRGAGRSPRLAPAATPGHVLDRHGGAGPAALPERARRDPGRDDRVGFRALPAPLPDRRPRGPSGGDGPAAGGHRAGAGRRASPWAPSACAPRWTRATWTPTPSSRARPCRRGTSYLEVQPRVAAVAPVGEGHFTLDYAPVFRAFATYDDVNSSSHSLGARIDLPVGEPGDAARRGPLPQRRPRHAGGGPRGGVLLRPRSLPAQRRRRGRQHHGRPAPERRARRRPRYGPLPGGVELLRLRHAGRLRGLRVRGDAEPQGGGLVRVRHGAPARRAAGGRGHGALGPVHPDRRDPAPPERRGERRLPRPGRARTPGRAGRATRASRCRPRSPARSAATRSSPSTRAARPRSPPTRRTPSTSPPACRARCRCRCPPGSSCGAGSATSGTTTAPWRARSASPARTASSAGTWACAARCGRTSS